MDERLLKTHGKQEKTLQDDHPLPLEKKAKSRETEPPTTSSNEMW